MATEVLATEALEVGALRVGELLAGAANGGLKNWRRQANLPHHLLERRPRLGQPHHLRASPGGKSPPGGDAQPVPPAGQVPEARFAAALAPATVRANLRPHRGSNRVCPPPSGPTDPALACGLLPPVEPPSRGCVIPDGPPKPHPPAGALRSPGDQSAAPGGQGRAWGVHGEGCCRTRTRIRPSTKPIDAGSPIGAGSPTNAP